MGKEAVSGPPRSRGWQLLRWCVRLGLVAVFLGVTATAWAYVYFVVSHPGEHLERRFIHEIISQESPVFYRDGVTPLGVFFAEEHRKYVRFENIPADFIHGLVAAEDQNFWEHGGFSPRGIGRAFVNNLLAGRVVEGGSTLTQQTAKNLFKRRGRTYAEKLRELANALRLERLYGKEDILEFYSNQFYVNGNGRGLAIAARFFFDKELADLDLVECAFVAGVVKSPNRYNPWVPGLERQERARAEARGRVDYVLGRMFEDGYLDEARYRAALADELKFERGHFRFARSVALDEVEHELSRPSFQLLLARHGIGDLGTSGLRITTTLDHGIQHGARYALRHHLTRVGTLLESPSLADLFGEAVVLKPVDPDRLARGYFHRGQLLSVDEDARSARVDLGGVVGVVDPTGNTRLAEGMKRARGKNNWARVGRKQTRETVAQLSAHIGESVLVSIREVTEDGEVRLDWERDGKIQGAVLVLEQGAVRAMVGGTLDSDYNRATVARRQFGSVWKPLVFEAALHLRWKPTDPLDNRRSVFPYQGGFYYPRPDHRDAPDSVSMAWATAKSENLASIWLLHRLTDRLSPQEFAQIATQVGLMPRSDESPRDFRGRVHKAGIVPTQGKLNEGLFSGAREDVGIDLAWGGYEREQAALEALHYGLGFAERLEKLASRKRISSEERAVRSGLLRQSFLRQEALAGRLDSLRGALLKRVSEREEVRPKDLEGLSYRRNPDGGLTLSYGDVVPEGFVVLSAEQLGSILPTEFEESSSSEVVSPEPEGTQDTAPDSALESAPAPSPEAQTEPLRVRPPDGLVKGKGEKPGRIERTEPLRTRPSRTVGRSDVALDPEEVPSPRSDRLAKRIETLRSLLAVDQVFLEGQLRPSTVESLRLKMAERRLVLGDTPRLYAPDQLALMQDYRVLVGIRYVIELARRSGVRSAIEPVQSLALGSSDITLLEVAQLYQVMFTGDTYQFLPSVEGALASGQDVDVDEEMLDQPFDSRRSADLPSAGLIARIERADGELIYEAVRDKLSVQDAQTAAEMGTMLRQVVRHGTGRRAKGAVRASSGEAARKDHLAALPVEIPLAGKTGTTNAYRNAAFVGMVPGLPRDGEDLTWGAGQVVAVYVGYDDNTEMKRGGIRIAGASGGLPVWIDVARACVEASDTGDRVDLVDLALSSRSELVLRFPEGFEEAPIDLTSGLLLDLSLEEAEASEAAGRLPVLPGEGRFTPYHPLPHRAEGAR